MSLDKAKRLKEKRDKAEKEKEPEPLDKPFPFRVQPFDPVFFGMKANPTLKAKTP